MLGESPQDPKEVVFHVPTKENLSERTVVDPDEELRKIELSKNDTLEITGGAPLAGDIERVGGAKNSGFKQMIAAASFDGKTTLTGISLHGDVYVTAKILKSIGCEVAIYSDGTVTIDPSSIRDEAIPAETGEASRASILMAGVLLRKFGRAVIPMPGGDKIGERPVDFHIAVLEAMGATCVEEVYEDVPGRPQKRLVFTTTNGLHPCDYKYPSVSHMATEQGIIAACNTEGVTTLRNCAKEPEVDALIGLMIKSGAEIKIDDAEDGTRTLTITGNRELHSVENEIMIDRNAVVTYAVAALVTKSERGITIKGARQEHIQSFLELLTEMNGGWEPVPGGIRFFYKEEEGLVAPKRVVVTCPEGTKLPDNKIGIMTDWQPLVCALFMMARGTTTLIEQVFPDRFHHLREAQTIGAGVKFVDRADEASLDAHYYFQSSKEGVFHAAYITGDPNLEKLKGIELTGSDVRLGAFGILLGLMIPKVSHVQDLRQIRRGYHGLIETLQSLNGKMTISRKEASDVPTR